jgi:hypothetical protein
VKIRTNVYIYLAISAAGILSNFIFWRYRLHLYDLNTDYDIEPLHHIQIVLFKGTLVFINCGLVLLPWRKFFDKK